MSLTLGFVTDGGVCGRSGHSFRSLEDSKHEREARTCSENVGTVCIARSLHLHVPTSSSPDTLQDLYVVALGVAIFLELAGGVLFLLGSPLGSCLLVCYSWLSLFGNG